MPFLQFFKIIAIAEGVSYLLFGITMPLKYVYEIPQPNYVVGMLHGILFLLYVVCAFVFISRYKPGMVKAFFILIASLLPFATFFVERKYLKPLEIK
ncbi:MAG: DUF3817 domain-containing protein [Owenweeksia sp.]